MGMVNEFKEFAVKGNAVDLAVGVIIGGAFGTIVKSLVDDVIMPPIGLALGGVDFADLFVTLRDRSHFLYSLHVLGFGLVLFCLNGFAFEYFWPNSTWLANAAVPLSMAYAMIAMHLFARDFLELPRRSPLANRLLLALAGFHVVMLIATPLVDYRVAVLIGTAMVFPGVSAVIGAAIAVARRGFRPDPHIHVATAADAFGERRANAWHTLGDILDLAAQALDDGSIGSRDLDTDRALDARGQHVDPVADRGHPQIGQAGNLDRRIEFGAQLLRGHAGSPLVAWLECHRGLEHLQRCRVRGRVRASGFAEHMVDLGHRPDHPVAELQQLSGLAR